MSIDDFSLLFGAFRTPFNINDDMIRPFFIKPRDNHVIYLLNEGEYIYIRGSYI